MAFHVACPLTCRKICYCSLGAPGLLQKFDGSHFQNGLALERLLGTSPFVLSTGQDTVEVLVPRLTKDHKKKKKKVLGGSVDGNNLRRSSFEQSKPPITGKPILSEYVEAEANGKFEELVEVDTSDKLLQETKKEAEEGKLNGNIIVNILPSAVPLVTCKICSTNEISDGEKARKMLSCKGCTRWYHQKCLKQWAQNRDLFNWASWLCGSCRYCEVCKRTGDADLLMFCKRCDEAYHSYCQQPSLKHVPSGPYLCPKHTRCHSCGSHVPGSGVSSRWFLSFNFCDACGRLFVKGKYCPICLKVYRESEPSPMVCCDVCEHWVHCSCDGISEDRYQQFQKDDNLLFKCAACRGECHQIKDMEDAVHELWKRRDDSERDQIAQLQASLGLPGKEEMKKICPLSSDDDMPNDNRQGHNGEIKCVEKFVPQKTEAAKNEFKSLVDVEKRGANKVTLKKAAKRTPKNPEGLTKTERHIGNKPKLHFQGTRPEKTDMYISNGIKNIPRERSKESQSEELEDLDSKVIDKTPAELRDNKQQLIVKSSKQVHRPKTVQTLTEIKAPTSLGNNFVEADGKKIHIKSTIKSKPIESQGVTELTEKMRSTKLILDLSANEFKKSDHMTKEPLLAKISEASKRPSIAFSKRKKVEVQSSGKREHSTAEISGGNNEDETSVGQESKSNKKPSEKSEPREFDGSFRTPKGEYPPPAWGIHSESRRRRLPSSKFRDMDTSAWHRMSAFTHLHLGGSERSNSTGSVSGSDGLPVATLSKQKTVKERKSQVNLASSEDSHDHPINSELSGSMVDERFAEPARKKVKVIHFNERGSEGPGKQKNPFIEGHSKKDLKLKFRKQSVIEGEKQSDGMHENSVKGQRTKRRRPATAESEETSEDLIYQTCFPGKIDNGDDTSILQRLGLDAVAKRVEVFQSKKNSWRKGTIVAVFPHKSQFSIQYDNGDKKTQKYGKERIRLLSTSKRSNTG
ncbi:hypothetical protein O6H91_01G121700 [Diphasiastrum complanatum]|uniref:Uncharacterized protein n=1 Tax=Diphasiastrum complanatum TaxID=34168 RepID=A0ACC2EVI2_DIPCM|nr:hypothetical protein O6H91_01G121700 [Diphasiastrum complanatum]